MSFFSAGQTRVIRLITHTQSGASPPKLGVFHAYGSEGPTASNLKEAALPTSGPPVIFTPGSTPTSGLRRSARLAQRSVTAVSSARDLSLEEPVIQDANPSDHNFLDGPCECETLELDPQPKIGIHPDVNHDDALSGESSNAETAVSENGHDTIQTQRATHGLVDSSHHLSDIPVSADMTQSVHSVPLDHSK